MKDESAPDIQAMPKDVQQAQEEEMALAPFQIVILLLSIYVLLAMAARILLPLPADVKSLLYLIDTVICFIFLGDFFIRFGKADRKLAFLKWGWIDFLASIPFLDQLRWARLVRVARILYLLRGFRSARTLISFLFRDKRQGAFAVAAFTALSFLFFCAIAILEIERDVPGSNIHSAGDALWWAFVTITTVGYGDFYPVTIEGRLVAAALMLVGIGLFGTLSGIMASILIGKDQERDEALVRLDARTSQILQRLEQRTWTREAKKTPTPDSEGPRSDGAD